MPTLQFKGKNIIWNHHLSVPYHTLEEVPKLHFQPKKADGNLIIEGDNLLALKALLPMYAGKIKCICIDPPYNTGNEGWAYNDNVNSPLIKDWLGKEVGKDDLTRHDKWLCMMTPRLRLLRELLADDGVICVNIGDEEVHNLRSLMNEVFGEDHYRNTISVRRFDKNLSRQFLEKGLPTLSIGFEYILIYSKTANCFLNPVFREASEERRNFGYWKGFWNAADRPTMRYELLGVKPQKGQWKWKKEIALEAVENYKKYQNKFKNKMTLEEYWEKTGKSKKFIRRRSDLQSGQNKGVEHWVSPSEGVLISSNWSDLIASETLKDFELTFDNPKNINVIQRVVELSTEENSLILDSFSGSGTTAHAVMDLNKEDGGNRKFILVQMTEATENEPDKNICKDITRERIKRAIEKYDYDSGFKYLQVGQPLDAETLLEGKLPDYKLFAKYVYYLCTGENLKEEKKISEKKFFVGAFGRQAIYLIYTRDYEALTRMALNLELAEKIIADQPDKKRIVYAPACFLDEEYMESNQIEFVSIPYNMFQRKTN